MNSIPDPMKKILDNYAKAIVDELLCLKIGDALSINSEESDLEFAKTVAGYAVKVTDVTVKIVLTQGGRPTDVMEFDPEPPAHDPKSFVMLRLAHQVGRVVHDGPVLEMIIDPNDLGSLQKYGHLAEPVLLNRRIAVPWCVVPVYDLENSTAWNEIAKKVDLGISNQGLATRYRITELENSKLEILHIRSSETDLSVSLPSDICVVSGCQTLGSGREFLSGFDFDRLSFVVDRLSTTGKVHGKAEVFGKEIDVDLVFEDGLLKDWTHSTDLDRILGFDDNLRRVGFVSIIDRQLIISLGGSLTEGLSSVPEEEENLPDFFNTSLYTLKVSIDGSFDVFGISSNGIQQTLVSEGFFIR